MNIIEKFILTIPLKTWTAACSASPDANEVCGWVLEAAGFIDPAGDHFVDVSTGGEEAADYVAAYFDAGKKFDKEAA